MCCAHAMMSCRRGSATVFCSCASSEESLGKLTACCTISVGLEDATSSCDEQLFHMEVTMRQCGKHTPVEIDSECSAATVQNLFVCTKASSQSCDVELKLSSEHLLPVYVDIVMKTENAVCGHNSVHLGFSRLLFWNFSRTFSSPEVLHTTTWEISYQEKLLFVICFCDKNPASTAYQQGQA